MVVLELKLEDHKVIWIDPLRTMNIYLYHSNPSTIFCNHSDNDKIETTYSALTILT